MKRRFLVRQLEGNDIRLDESQAHHARVVLRLGVGDDVELFDAAGASADAQIVSAETDAVIVRVAIIRPGKETLDVTVAAAVPKGDRADWMVEKLSELGVSRFIPLAAERSVVLPEGKSKRQRWERLAVEAAKQSKRAGVMAIGPLSTLPAILPSVVAGIVLSTEGQMQGMADAVETGSRFKRGIPITLFIGPEGGWTEAELADFASAGVASVHLPTPVLRVETAAVVAAAILFCMCPLHSAATPELPQQIAR